MEMLDQELWLTQGLLKMLHLKFVLKEWYPVGFLFHHFFMQLAQPAEV